MRPSRLCSSSTKIDEGREKARREDCSWAHANAKVKAVASSSPRRATARSFTYVKRFTPRPVRARRDDASTFVTRDVRIRFIFTPVAHMPRSTAGLETQTARESPARPPRVMRSLQVFSFSAASPGAPTLCARVCFPLTPAHTASSRVHLHVGGRAVC